MSLHELTKRISDETVITLLQRVDRQSLILGKITLPAREPMSTDPYRQTKTSLAARDPVLTPTDGAVATRHPGRQK